MSSELESDRVMGALPKAALPALPRLRSKAALPGCCGRSTACLHLAHAAPCSGVSRCLHFSHAA
jgi:hypothetical protein